MQGKETGPLSCTISPGFFLSLTLFDRRLAHALIKMYAVIKDLGDGHIFSHTLVRYVLQGKKRQWPVQHASLPYWKLPVMLDTLV